MQSPAAEIGLARASRTALVVRWIVSAHIGVLLLQLVLAIAAVAGAAVFHAHAMNARLVAASGVLQAIGVLAVSSARAGWFIKTMAFAVAVGETTQLYLGLGGGMALHVTLAMTVWALSLAIFIRAWAPGWTRED